jgi:hypothetical protein
MMVRVVGLEPTLLSEPDFESDESYRRGLNYKEFLARLAVVR